MAETSKQRRDRLNEVAGTRGLRVVRDNQNRMYSVVDVRTERPVAEFLGGLVAVEAWLNGK